MTIISCDKSDPPMVVSYIPDFGPEQTLITVEGMDFSDLLAINFNNGIAADFNPSYGTDKALLFRVPFGAPLGDNQILIKTEAGEVTFPFRVTLDAPEIDNFNPKSANEGDLVYIIGENFFEPLEVLFADSVAGEIVYFQEDSISVRVPAGVSKGQIKVKANGGSANTAEVFFSTTEVLVNDFDGNGVRSETSKWKFTGFVDQTSAANAIFNINPDPISNNFIKLSGKDDLNTTWLGGAENHSNDAAEFENFGIFSDINNTFIEMDINSNNRKDSHLIIVLTQRNGLKTDFTETIKLDWDGWRKIRIPLNRFADLNGFTVDPAEIKTVKLHLVDELKTKKKLEANIDNIKFILIN